jgi:23S rRNA (uracil1939-C5)-methyltransferase
VRDRCGGCQLQHLRYDAQLAAKSRIVGDALARIGKRETPRPEVRPSPLEWRYRRKLTLALRRRGAAWIAGLHPFDAPGRVFALEDCPITDERVLAAWRAILDAASLLPEARELRGAVRLDAEEGTSVSFVLEGGRSWPRHTELMARVPMLSSLWWVRDGGRRTLLARRGGDAAPGASFGQVNAAVADELQHFVLARARTYDARTIVDGYAGIGDTAAALAREGTSVTAIELDPDAAAWSAARLPDGSRSIAARVEDVLPELLPADVVIVNPPRSGLDARVAATLQDASAPPRGILYVSCNPATLARDLARLPRYRIASLRSFDMFPQTAHVETVCELVPEPA